MKLLVLNLAVMGNTAVKTGVGLGILAAVAGILAYLFLGERGEERRDTAKDWMDRTKEIAKEKMSSMQDEGLTDKHIELRAGKRRIHVGYETEE